MPLLDRDALARELASLKAGGKRIVFTNGCFDILHAGHVRYLAEARALGDVLVVGLNSDSSVSVIKPGRPINNQDDRAEVLLALRAVDYVCVFDEETPYELLQALLPDVLVKGGDWKPQDIVGSDLVPDTRSLPFVEGRSTTAVIERIIELYEAEDSPWEVFFVTYDPIEAGIVRDILEGGGIEVRTQSLKVEPYPVNVGRMGEVKIRVRAGFHEAAQRLIDEAISEHHDEDE